MMSTSTPTPERADAERAELVETLLRKQEQLRRARQASAARLSLFNPGAKAKRCSLCLPTPGGDKKVCVDLTQRPGQGIGFVVWPSALPLAAHVCKMLSTPPRNPRRRRRRRLRLIELGSGAIALSSLLAATTGQVAAVGTDLPPVAALCSTNTASACSALGVEDGAVITTSLDICDATAMEKHRGGFDIVCGSDLLYSPELREPLAKAIAGLLSRRRDDDDDNVPATRLGSEEEDESPVSGVCVLSFTPRCPEDEEAWLSNVLPKHGLCCVRRWTSPQTSLWSGESQTWTLLSDDAAKSSASEKEARLAPSVSAGAVCLVKIVRMLKGVAVVEGRGDGVDEERDVVAESNEEEGGLFL